MIAAPKTYDFGTQIFFEGLGLGRVEDRGGAIVEAFVRGQAHDRIDIWVGSGDEWLRRARAWGRREVRWTIVKNDTRDPINIEGILNGSVNLAAYPRPAVANTTIGGLSSDVIAAFADLGYSLSGNDTKAMIAEFQLEQKVIASKDEEGAGVYGPRTRAMLALLTEKRNAELAAAEQARNLLLTDHDAWEKQYKQAETTVTSFGQPQLKEKWDGIKLLQSFLQSGKHYVEIQMDRWLLVLLWQFVNIRNQKISKQLENSMKILESPWLMILHEVSKIVPIKILPISGSIFIYWLICFETNNLILLVLCL
jgi:hypothetical protein